MPSLDLFYDIFNGESLTKSTNAQTYFSGAVFVSGFLPPFTPHTCLLPSWIGDVTSQASSRTGFDAMETQN